MWILYIELGIGEYVTDFRVEKDRKCCGFHTLSWEW